MLKKMGQSSLCSFKYVPPGRAGVSPRLRRVRLQKNTQFDFIILGILGILGILEFFLNCVILGFAISRKTFFFGDRTDRTDITFLKILYFQGFQRSPTNKWACVGR